MNVKGDFDVHQPGEQTADGILKNVYGYKTFRPGQREAISAVSQQKDSIVVIPTGGGKTVIYSYYSNITYAWNYSCCLTSVDANA